jgi:hypothetical protein
MEGGFFLRNIILFVIGITSCIVAAWGNRRAYIRGEYDPNIFRLRQGYEWKLTMMLASMGMLLPAPYMEVPIPAYLYILIVFGTFLLTISILNFKCYKKIRKKRILIYNIIIDVPFIILIIFLYYKIFK